MLFPSKSTLIVTLAGLAIGLGGFAYQQYQIYKRDSTISELTATSLVLEERIAYLNDEATRASAMINNYKQTLAEHRTLESLYKESISTLTKESNAKSAEIRKYRNRQDIVFAKPGLVERLEQKALDNFFAEVENQ